MQKAPEARRAAAGVSPDKQLSLTDPDARSMKSRDGGIVGYNVQTAVDAKHHLIVAHEVITEGVDRDQLAPMSERAQDATGVESLQRWRTEATSRANRSRSVKRPALCQWVPKTLTSNSLADGRFDKQDFIYIASDDEYRCPAGQRAIKRFTTVEAGMTLDVYWSSACTHCPIKAQCTTSDYRRIRAMETRAVLEAMQLRLDRQPEMMRSGDRQLSTVRDHQTWMGATHFLTRTPGARAHRDESARPSLITLKRVVRILGTGAKGPDEGSLHAQGRHSARLERSKMRQECSKRTIQKRASRSDYRPIETLAKSLQLPARAHKMSFHTASADSRRAVQVHNHGAPAPSARSP